MKSVKVSIKKIGPDEIMNRAIDVFLHSHPWETLEPYISEKFMGYGSALDEKIIGKERIHWMIDRQQKEIGSAPVKTTRHPIYQHISPSKNSVIIVEELDIFFGEEKQPVPLRITVTFDKADHYWYMVHMHASIADANTPDGSAWPIEELKRKNLELEQKVVERTAQLERSIQNLKNTQAQLIHAEKMASLGELTAGIAHEIQNPLNFINNFAEVNTELIAEIFEELEEGNLDELKLIAENIKTNEEKIVSHGKRADSIIKGMLQHSRTGEGEKQKVDLNGFVDEYVRLAYHGLRAKDKSFNTSIETDFDEEVGNLEIIPQDLGRVLLNLINNAFYAVDKKGKKKNTESYQPNIIVKTTLLSSISTKEKKKILISIHDNGLGIPKNLITKIFQPFFTTKPTGLGTGLGLSLSFDIVKAHGGELKVESEEGKYTKFTILLPV